MGRKKLGQFVENAENPLFFQPYYEEVMAGFPLKGKWRADFFKNDNPVVLELGCGKGEYAVGLAQRYPDKNFVGVDLKGARMWRGATDAREAGLGNVAFIRTKIQQILHYFGPNEVDEIWLTFSDPQPRHERRRLSSPRFLNLYRQLLKPYGIIHIKTDSKELFNYSMEVIKYFELPLEFHSYDLYKSGYDGDASKIQTFYENQYLAKGVPINYALFSLDEKYNSNELDKLPEDE